MNTKHKIKIDASNIKLIPNPKKSLRISASEKISKMFPENIPTDLVYISLVSHTLNHVNQNDCLITTDEGLASYKTLISKALDIEHERREIVGFCVDSQLMNLKNNKILSEDAANEILTNGGMVNVVGIFAVWKINNPEVAGLIEENFDENSAYFNTLKASFEYYFNDYDFFVSNGNADYPDGKIISGDAANSEELFNTLRINGGNGMFENQRISIIPKGGFVGGCALTLAPANEFSDVLAKKDGDTVVVSDLNVENVKIDTETSVSINTGDIMPEKITAPEVIAETKTEVKVDAALPQLSVDKDVADKLQSQLDVKISEMSAKDQEIANLKADFAKAQEDSKAAGELAAQLQTKFDSYVAELNKMKADAADKAQKEMIVSRMKMIADIMEVSDSNKTVLEKESATLSDEDFTKKLDFYKSICKKVDASVKTDTETSVKESVTEVAVTEAVKTTPVVDIIAAAPAKTLITEFQEAFGTPEKIGLKIK